jgi:hypothetical protein
MGLHQRRSGIDRSGPLCICGTAEGVNLRCPGLVDRLNGDTGASLILGRCQIVQRLMQPLAIVEDLDVIEDGRPRLLASVEGGVVDELVPRG